MGASWKKTFAVVVSDGLRGEERKPEKLDGYGRLLKHWSSQNLTSNQILQEAGLLCWHPHLHCIGFLPLLRSSCYYVIQTVFPFSYTYSSTYISDEAMF